MKKEIKEKIENSAKLIQIACSILDDIPNNGYAYDDDINRIMSLLENNSSNLLKILPIYDSED